MTERGWTVDPPLPSGAIEMHVDLTGSDANPGTESEPKRTVAAAKSLMVPGRGDRVWLRRGRIFDEAPGSWLIGGAAGRPTIVGAYGPLGEPRPILRCEGTALEAPDGHDVDHLWIRDLDLMPLGYDGTQDWYGIVCRAAAAGWLVEGCRIAGFRNNLAITPWAHAGLPRAADFKIRRCVVAGAWHLPSSSGHSQGLYGWRTDDLLVEDCIFYGNGTATIFDHGAYLAGQWDDDGQVPLASSGFTFRNNFVAASGSHGLQARSGGTIEGNVFSANAIGCLIGDRANPVPVTGTMRGNVAIAGRNISPALPRGWGFMCEHLDAGVVERNVATMLGAGLLPFAWQRHTTSNTRFQGNAATSWPGFLIEQDGPANLDIDNDWFGAGTYPDAGRTLARYAGEVANLPAQERYLLGRMLDLRRGDWAPELTPASICQWLLAGHGIGG